MKHRKLAIAFAVLAIIGIAAALAPNCSEPVQQYVGRVNVNNFGVLSGTTTSQITFNDQCVDTNGTYYNHNSTSTGYGQWDLLQSGTSYCYAVGKAWTIPAEYGDGTNRFVNEAEDVVLSVTGVTPGCLLSGTVHDVQDSCAAHPCCGTGGVGCGSPLVGDPDGAGFIGNLTSLQDGVKFDFNNTGKLIQIAWLRKGSGLLFLVYDWDHDGGIPRDGHDFIGTTSCPNAANGFKALAKLDSDHDGWITPKDTEWKNIRLWDGYSQRTVSLESKGYTAISLRYTQKPQHDDNGNGLSLWAHAKGDLRDPNVVDVYFVEAQ